MARRPHVAHAPALPPHRYMTSVPRPLQLLSILVEGRAPRDRTKHILPVVPTHRVDSSPFREDRGIWARTADRGLWTVDGGPGENKSSIKNCAFREAHSHPCGPGLNPSGLPCQVTVGCGSRLSNLGVVMRCYQPDGQPMSTASVRRLSLAAARCPRRQQGEAFS